MLCKIYCMHMWHVSSRSAVATLRTAIHLLTFLVTATKLNEQELMSAELCRQCCILNLLSLD